MSGTNNNQTSEEQIQALGLTLPSDRSQAIKLITGIYLEQVDPDDWIDPEKIASDVIQMVKTEFVSYNQNAETGTKWKVPPTLEPEQIAMIMLRLHRIITISFTDFSESKDYDALAIYQEYGKDAGIYITDQTEIRNLIRRYNNSIKTRDINEVLARLQDQAERKTRSEDRDLIAVNNGVFNYRTKILEPFTPNMVFTAKCRVDYNPTATSPVIHNDQDQTDWEIEGWIKDLFDDGSDIPETIWQIIGAIIRPNVSWGRSIWLYSSTGANAKGTLCELMRNLAGKGSYASIQLSEFKEKFALEPLVRATSIITDENDVGAYIDKVANLKAIITNDVISIDRKFKSIIKYRFRGIIVECLNSRPRLKDQSESFYRRMLIIPFTKSFTGMERKYIKDDYLNREDVLQYVLYRVLNMDYYEFTVPECCKMALDEYKTFNDPVKDFLEDILPRASWGCLPNQFLFDMYKGWSKENNPNGTIQGRNTFIDDVKNLIKPSEHGWYYVNPKSPTRVLNRMDGEEPLMDEYNCTNWMINPNSTNIDYRIRVKLGKKKSHYSGLFKVNYTPPKESGIVIYDDNSISAPDGDTDAPAS